MWHDGLTEKQRRFCEAYASNGGNALAAARDAGYAKPDPQGAQNLGIPSIIAALELLRSETTNKAIATREERQSFWTAVMRGEILDRAIIGEDGGEIMGSAKLADRLKASELLGKSQADFIDRKELTGKDGAPLAPTRIEIVPGRFNDDSTDKAPA